ncbi:DUF106 domain-containing protein [Haloarchaeobius iranensis]|uniref:Uncharacterized membrane protein, DUF106 family n=1 Tax=Haloarchaeobius iranensis TaxID=996166 RepID=A0A1H0ARU6_9EURY|nr:EMC3/TMCO1 family protein [Haloarchaeobius iranensis]SDN36079.1 Uncharacterized membrane protein, DUF106 family [Haloarchaeobius iranensis]
MVDTDDAGWTTADRVAGLLALVLATGYVLPPIQGAVATAWSAVLAPLAVILPFSVLLCLLAGVNGLFTAIAQVKLRDSERVERFQARTEELQARLRAAREADDLTVDDLDEEQHELNRTMVAMLKTNFRPLVWSMLVTIPTFLWLRWVFLAPAAGIAPAMVFVPLVGQLSWTATVVGPVKLWLAWYFGASLSSGFVARRLVRRVAADG